MKAFFSIFSIFLLAGSGCLVSGQENTAQKQAAVQSFKVAPCYFIANTASRKTGKRLVDDHQVSAFVQTRKGRVMFTPSGAYIGMAVPVDELPKPGSSRHSKHMARDLPAVQTRTVVLKTGFSNARASKRGILPRLEEVTSGTVNFMLGPKEQWRTKLPTYRKLVYDRVWDGIDLEYLGYMDRLEFRLKLEAGSDPAQIVMETGGDELEILEDGQLKVSLAGAEMVWSAPYAYQVINRQRVAVPVQYRLFQGGKLGFQLGRYHADYPLIIDPTLTWSTFLGGSANDYAEAIAVDGSGHAYITGDTGSAGYPVTTGAYDETYNGYTDVFVSKLNKDASGLLYSTFLGGSSSSLSYGIAVDTSGNAYVTGYTSSSTYPVTSGAFDVTHNGNTDGFVSVLNNTGSGLVYSTFLGSADSDYSYGIAVDTSGNAYVTGETESSDYPITSGAFDKTHNGGSDVFVSVLNNNGSSLVYSTFLGGANNDFVEGIALDTSGNAYVTGATLSSTYPVTIGAFDEAFNGNHDVFVSVLNSNGSGLIYSTFIGGTDSDFSYGIAVDTSGNAYVTGETESSNFPATRDAFGEIFNGLGDGFVSVLNNTGSGLVYSTFLGGADVDFARGIALDTSGNAYVTGQSYSSNFPVTSGAFDESHNGLDDVFVSVLNNTGSGLVYSTFLGGADRDYGRGIALDISGNAYVTGSTNSGSYPTTSGAFDETLNGNYDVFVSKINFAPVQPEIIYGDTVICVHNSGFTHNYVIPLVPEASSYTWTVPPDANIVAGQGGPSINVIFGDLSGNVSVTASNSYGKSEPQHLYVLVNQQLSTLITPATVAQGLDNLIFTVEDQCAEGDLIYVWTNLTTGEIYESDHTLELPVVDQSTQLQLVVTDEMGHTFTNEALILCHTFLLLDLNGDGCNSLEDLWLLIQDWRQDINDDPNGDGLVDVRDFLFINLDDPTPCPARSLKKPIPSSLPH